MENAKKMIIVSADVLQRMQSSPSPSSTSVSKVSSDTVGELDREMSRLLNNKSLSDQDKWEQYQQVLQRYLHFASQKRKPIQLPVVEMNVDDDAINKNSMVSNEEIVETFTKTYKKDARNFLKAIGGKKDLITWDSEGGVYINQEKVPHSNIIDLVHDVIRVRKSIQPPGWEQLMHVLKDINIPNEFVTNPFSREYLMRIKGSNIHSKKSESSGSSSSSNVSDKEDSSRNSLKFLKKTSSSALGKLDDKYPTRGISRSSSRTFEHTPPSPRRGRGGASWEKFKL